MSCFGHHSTPEYVKKPSTFWKKYFFLLVGVFNINWRWKTKQGYRKSGVPIDVPKQSGRKGLLNANFIIMLMCLTSMGFLKLYERQLLWKNIHLPHPPSSRTRWIASMNRTVSVQLNTCRMNAHMYVLNASRQHTHTQADLHTILRVHISYSYTTNTYYYIHSIFTI